MLGRPGSSGPMLSMLVKMEGDDVGEAEGYKYCSQTKIWLYFRGIEERLCSNQLFHWKGKQRNNSREKERKP